jgi:peptidoglycan/xylan/chitin deacetylase (PgdA/CDA1 family)
MHRVEPYPKNFSGFAPNANLSSTPQFLNDAIIHFRNSGFDFIGMDDVPQRLQHPNKKPFVVFTLDDGYKDNAEHALPVFKMHNVPFTIYIAPNLVEGTTEMWWDALEAIIRDYSEIDIEIAGQTTRLLSDNKLAAWKVLSQQLQALPELEQRQWVRDQAKRFDLNLSKMCTDVIMTWDEIRAIAAEPLATIGAHTLHHYAVLKLSEADARHEIVESGKIVERQIGKPVRHFAFPYGNVAHAGPRDFRIAREAGYETAVTTRLGSVHEMHSQHLHALPRVIVSGTYQKPEWLEVLASGFPSFIKNRGTHLNVG